MWLAALTGKTHWVTELCLVSSVCLFLDFTLWSEVRGGKSKNVGCGKAWMGVGVVWMGSLALPATANSAGEQQQQRE